jgi:hypothetical protein
VTVNTLWKLTGAVSRVKLANPTLEATNEHY